MGLTKSHDSNNERRDTERYKSSIIVLIQKEGIEKTRECMLLDISLKGFAIRLQSGKSNLNVNDKFLFIINPSIFDIEEVDKIKINSVCTRIDLETFIIGAKFFEISTKNSEFINLIVNSFKKINENDY